MGRPEAMDALPEPLRRAIVEWVLSHARHTATRIYRKFNLAEHGIKTSTFRHWVRRTRERAPDYLHQDETDRDYDDAEELLSALTTERLESGDVKSVAPLMMAMAARRRVSIQERAENRAKELHDIKIEQLSKDLRKDVEERTEGGKTLTREDVYDMIDKIVRGGEQG